MPFTPFHMGVGMLAKAVLDRRLSLVAYGLAQIAMDVEPLIGMLRASSVLHGWSHSLWGACLVGAFVSFLTPWLAPPFWRRWSKECVHYRLDRLNDALPCSRQAILVGAFFGTVSHALLDSVMHDDLRLFAPWSAAQPVYWPGSGDLIMQGSMLAGLIGLVAWGWRKLR